MGRHRVLVLVVAIGMIACAKSGQNNRNNTQSANQAATSTGVASQPDNNPPLLREVNAGNAEAVRQMLEGGASANTASATGVTPLMNAAGMGNKEIVQMLLAKGANVNARTPGDYTALMSAANNNQPEMVKILLDAGADPSVKDNGGRTALAYAEGRGNKEVIAILKGRK